MKKIIHYSFHKLIIGILLFFSCSNLYPQAAPENYEGVMLQGFYWDSYNETNWNALNLQSEDIASYFDLIWLPPSGNAQGTPQYPNMGYHPIWYFNQNSSFGSSNELKLLITSLKDKGCGSIADIVINHRNGQSTWTDFPSETYNNITYTWGSWAICSGDEVKNEQGEQVPTGASDTGENWDGARDIDHTNEYVQNTIKAYLDFMKNEMGYIGWRYDFVKGFSPYYVGMYNMSAGCNFSVGEYWDNYDRTTEWIDGTIINSEIRSGAFDFDLKYALRDACNYGQWNKLMWPYNANPQPAGLIHNPGFKRFAYTFVDNHDTAEKSSDAISSENTLAANAFVLTHPGIPCIFYPHWRDYKSDIKKLIDIRKMVGISSQSTVEVKESAGDIYVGEVFGTRGSLIIKIGSRYNYNPPSDYTFKISGTNFAVWTKSAQEGTMTSSSNPIISNMETTLYYDGTGTNFANWSPASHIHAWLVPKAGETFSQTYSTTWVACEGNDDYNALDSKLKMTTTGTGKYSIDMNIKDFFNVTEEDLEKIAKLGVIVRALYDEGSYQNRTINFLLNVTKPSSTVGLNNKNKANKDICYSENNSIIVKTDSKANVTIYSIYGTQVRHSLIENTATFDNIEGGIYLVKINDKTQKIFVK